MSDLSSGSIPRGFRFAAVKAGLKASGRPDFALIVADEPASAAAAFTSNRVIAAPLIVDKENLSATGGRVRVAAINAGNANCAAGEAGLRGGASDMRGCCADIWLPGGGSFSVVDRDYRRAAAGGEADCCAAGAGGESWIRCRVIFRKRPTRF